jgi:hypothetical protein
MKPILFSIILLGLPLVQTVAEDASQGEQVAERLDCSRVRSGLFYYLEPSGLFIIVEREPARQRQHRLYNKFFKIESVAWTSECDYTLQTVQTHDPLLESAPRAPLHISILRISADYYEYRERGTGQWSESKRMYFLRDLEKAISLQTENAFNRK